MKLPRRQQSSKPINDLLPSVELWVLRMLVSLNAHHGFITHYGFGNDAIAHAFGLGAWIDQEGRDFDPKAVRAALRKRYETRERTLRDAAKPPCLTSNVARLSHLVGLSETDCRILEFVVLIKNDPTLDDAADWLGHLSSSKVFHALSVLLDLPEQDVRTSLDASSILSRSGLVCMSRNGACTLGRKLELISDDFADRILSSDTDPVSLLRGMVTRASLGVLSLTDFEHIGPSLGVLRPYLLRAMTDGRKGVNVYVYGKPGTGKSELAKVLAKEIGCELFEVASEDAEGDPVSGKQRLRAFRAAQSFFSKRQAVVVFDEAEDVFNDGGGLFSQKSTAQASKAWINRILEENAVPAFWLSNSIEGLDPAFVRRFDMVLALSVPPKKQRLRIIEQTCSDVISSCDQILIAESEALTPAVVTRAASVVRLIRDDLDQAGASSAMALLIDSTLEAQGHAPILRSRTTPILRIDTSGLPEVYDAAFIHADADLTQIASGLVQSRSGRLCLYGPPGTGKTAYGRWLATQMGVPLTVKRASDLMSKYLGESEKNIARAFRQAEQEGSVLLIDEIDGFLQDRRNVHRSWEISPVNEMLTQMELFGGVLVASTNLVTGLDPAALRRFDLKVKLDFLKVGQAGELLGRYCHQLSFDMPVQEQLARLTRLQNLTPGDFATVVRQSQFRPVTSADMLIAALEAECALKEGAASAIGFF